MKSTFEEIYENLIKPIEAAFEKKFPVFVKEFTVEELTGFDNQTLKKAARQIIKTRKFMPNMAHLLEACEQARNPEGKGDTKRCEDLIAALKAKDDKANELQQAYLKQHLKSSTMAEAKACNYQHRLFAYVREVAWYQAQMIAGVANPGIDWLTVFNRTMPEQRQINDFLREQRAQILTGVIDVAVPVGLIQAWKAQYSQQAIAA